MPDTCLSSEIPQIQQISALPNESLEEGGKLSMYSSEEGKMQMKTNAKSLPFMFQVPNYAWHFNFPKACFRKIVLNSPRSVQARVSSAVAVHRSGWAVKCNQGSQCWHEESHAWLLCSRARSRPCALPSAGGTAQPEGLLCFGDSHRAPVPVLGIQGVHHLHVVSHEDLCVHSQKVSSPGRNMQPLKFSLVLNVPTFLGSLEAWIFDHIPSEKYHD